MNRVKAEIEAFKANQGAPKGVAYFAVQAQDGTWGVNHHDGRRKK